MLDQTTFDSRGPMMLSFLGIGAAAGWWSGRRYMQRGIRRKLVVHLGVVASLFGDLGPDVRRQFEIAYQGSSVEDLTHVRFAIANEGETAITDLISPLTVSLPIGVRPLSVSVAHRSGDHLRVSTSTTRKEVDDGFLEAVTVQCDLLNPGDRYVVSLLLNGSVSREDLQFDARGENLRTPLAVVHYATRKPPPWHALALYAVTLAFVAPLAFMVNRWALHQSILPFVRVPTEGWLWRAAEVTGLLVAFVVAIPLALWLGIEVLHLDSPGKRLPSYLRDLDAEIPPDSE